MQSQQKVVQEAAKILAARPDVLAAVAAGSEKETKEVAEEAREKSRAWEEDVVLFRMAIIVLGALALTLAFSALGLTILHLAIPESLIAIGSAAVGALVGLFSPSPVAR